MKFKFRLQFAAALGAIATISASGQVPGQSGAAASSQRSDKASNFGQLMADAMSSASSGDIETVERNLSRDFDTARPARAHLVVANRLIQVASEVAHQGKANVVSAVAKRALQHLQTAEQLAASDLKIKTGAATLAGFIYERYMGDLAEARSRYAAAVALDSKATQASEALERLTKRGSAITTPTGGAQ